MLLVFSSKKTTRLQYILQTLMEGIGVAFELTDSADHFVDYKGPKINYSSSPLTPGELWICPADLLFETTIKEQSIRCFLWKKMKAFFATSGELAFDIFATSFYLLTRYEEYLPHAKDEYGRYAHKNSIAFKEKFLNQPLVNLWLKDLSDLLLQKFPSLNLQPSKFQFVPTYDVDIAWSYFSKGFSRNLGGILKSLTKGEWTLIKERFSVIMGSRDDPFDVYAWLDDLHEQHKLKPIYFFLLATRIGKYDKNTNPKNKYFRLLIRKLSVMYRTGIHPSWQSGNNKSLFRNELELLKKIIDKPVEDSRQHYIRMSLPATYQQLIDAGIRNDYSMGYGSINGFRASYCLPYKWYDLSKEETTELTVYPFCYMEANSLFEQHYSAPRALEELQQYYDVTQSVSGMLITIFHNHLLTTQPHRIAWRNMYENFLKSINQ
jgi:hypothetical protein